LFCAVVFGAGGWLGYGAGSGEKEEEGSLYSRWCPLAVLEGTAKKAKNK
jgi:hypothetical protein